MLFDGFIRLCVMYVFFTTARCSTISPIRTLETHVKNTAKNIIFTEDDDRNDEIIFPDEDVPSTLVLKTPPKCVDKKSTYCEKVHSYPHRYVKDILRNAQGYSLFFGEDEAEDEDLVERNSNVEQFVCSSVVKVIFPQGAKNSKDQWRFIVNQPADGYVQGIRVEECASANGPCDIAGIAPEGIETTCKQKYIQRRLLAISEHGSPAVDTFLFPSACCCSYKRNYATYWDNF